MVLVLPRGRTMDHAHLTRTMEAVLLMEDLDLVLPLGILEPVPLMLVVPTQVASTLLPRDPGRLLGALPMLVDELLHGVVHLHLATPPARTAATMHRHRARTIRRLRREHMAVPLLLVPQHRPLAVGLTVLLLRVPSTHLHQVHMDPRDTTPLPRQLLAAVRMTLRRQLWQLHQVQLTTEDHGMKRAHLVLRLAIKRILRGHHERKLPKSRIPPAKALHSNFSTRNKACTILFHFPGTIGSCTYGHFFWSLYPCFLPYGSGDVSRLYGCTSEDNEICIFLCSFEIGEAR